MHQKPDQTIFFFILLFYTLFYSIINNLFTFFFVHWIKKYVVHTILWKKIKIAIDRDWWNINFMQLAYLSVSYVPPFNTPICSIFYFFTLFFYSLLLLPEADSGETLDDVLPNLLFPLGLYFGLWSCLISLLWSLFLKLF